MLPVAAGSPAAGSECLVHFTVIRGVDLPKTELTSKIDAYVKVKCGAFAGKTRAKEDDDNPVWNTDFFFNMPLGPNRVPSGTICLELFDENTFKDSRVGSATLQLSLLQPSQLAYIELPLTWEKEKYGQQGKQSRLVVALAGWVASFATLMAATRHIPGALYNVVDRRAYLPIPFPQVGQGVLYLGVEYESHAVDFKIFICQAGVPLFVDLAMAGRQHTKVRRRVYRDGQPIMPGLVAFEEVKLDDVPLSTDFRQLLVLVFDKQLLWSGNSDRIVSAHGWRGALGFADACRTLHSVDIDQQEQEIYMRVFDDTPGAALAPPEAMLLVDYDKSDVDIKLAVLHTPSALDKAWDLTIHSGQQVKKTSEIFVPPRSRVGGRYHVARVFELDDVAYGTSFADILIHKYQLSNQRQFDVASLLPLR